MTTNAMIEPHLKNKADLPLHTLVKWKTVEQRLALECDSTETTRVAISTGEEGTALGTTEAMV